MHRIKYFIILGLLVIGGLVYLKLKPANQENITINNAAPKVVESSTETATGSSSAQNAYSETGWTAFVSSSQIEPEPDVVAEFSIGKNSSENKEVSVKKGQRVQLKFTSSINDQAKVEGYNTSVYIMPLGEFSTTFTADKTGQFPIVLVNNKRTVGTLKVN